MGRDLDASASLPGRIVRKVAASAADD